MYKVAFICKEYVGIFGQHDYVQSKSVPFETAMAVGITSNMSRRIREEADIVNERLGHELGACGFAEKAGLVRRFTNMIAIAPTSSISHTLQYSIAPGIEPHTSNYYTVNRSDGIFPIKNYNLQLLINSYAKNNFKAEEWVDEVWRTILDDGGSVKNQSWMTGWEKDVYKTAFELDQMWLIEHAAMRAPYIDQGQSLNIFIDADIEKTRLAMIHYTAWKRNLKSLYYLKANATKTSFKSGIKTKEEVLSEPVEYNECLSCQ